MNLRRQVDPDGTCLLIFDRPGSSANIFDLATLQELEAELDFIGKETGLSGLILASAKPKIFIAGADINAFARGGTDEEIAGVIDLGHRIFNRIAALGIPSAAAINGVCLGGGCEAALACDWRVAAAEKGVKLGFPETQLGILPAWGGSSRLPGLIGLPQALNLILSGRQLTPEQAKRFGLVDEVAPAGELVAAAKKLLRNGRRRPSPPTLASRPPLARFIAAKARRDVLARTRGNYPAPLKAIEVCAGAAGAPLPAGLKRERAAFLELVRTPQSRNLVGLFLLQERAKKLAVPGTNGGVRTVRRAAVIGAGLMGTGIAQWISGRGIPVLLQDVAPEPLARGMRAAEALFRDAVRRRLLTEIEARAALDRITPEHLPVPLSAADLVVEAAVEQLDLKRRIFLDLEGRTRPETVLATNTSALSIRAIAEGLKHPERVVGMHFFNPVHRMQLVEIIRGPASSADALETAVRFVRQIGKLPVLVKDSPGFLVNRILVPYLMEALQLFSQGARVNEIDRALLDFGMPMGPLRLADEVGLDTARHVAADLERRLPRLVPLSGCLEKMVERGWLGRKSGCGFYRYGRKGREKPNPEARRLQPEPGNFERSDILDRLILIMVNEAARCLEEGVVAAPEDVDFSMVMGTGWAPFRGGPLRHADALGSAKVAQRLRILAQDGAAYLNPCERLIEMAAKGESFYP